MKIQACLRHSVHSSQPRRLEFGLTSFEALFLCPSIGRMSCWIVGFNDDGRFPDFSHITKEGSLDDYLDCVIISHFHLDHCGALPYMTEMVGYSEPIYMTHSTKTIVPILLDDFRRITVDHKGDTNFFTHQMIKDCVKKAKAVTHHAS